MLSSTRKQEIIDKLVAKMRARGKEESCPMCGNDKFFIADAYFTNVLQTDLNNMKLTGLSVPSIAIICHNCGFISQHALGALGLVPEEAMQKSEEVK